MTTTPINNSAAGTVDLSLIVPCFNEAENMKAFQNAVINAFSDYDGNYEIIFVDDGSKDDTLMMLRKIKEEKRCAIKIISFSRNFGKEAAIFAGLKYAVGKYISIIDADLQQRPEIVRKMIRILDENPDCDVVAAYQECRQEGKVLSFLKKCFYRTINWLSDVKLQENASDFRTFRRGVADSILSMPETQRFSKGIFSWIGYRTQYIPYTACTREAGTTKWNVSKLINYALDGIMGFSIRPLRLIISLSGISAFASAAYLLIVLCQKIIGSSSIPIYAAVIVLILFLNSIQLFCIGIVGEYVGRTFEQTKHRPIYLAKEIVIGDADL